MAASITFVPDALNFPGVMPGTFGPDITPVGDLPSFSGGIHIKNAPVGAKVTFTLIDETGHFTIRDAFVMELVEEFVGGGDGGSEGPPGGPGGGHGGGPRPKIKVLQVVGQSDGLSPIQVNQGQDLLVRVQYAVLEVEGFFEPTLVIQGDTWETVSIPISLFPALVTSTVSDTLQIAQGNQAQLAVVARSVMGPGVDVSYQMSNTQVHTGLSLLPNSQHLPPKQAVTGSITFQADPNAPLGVNQVAIDQITFRPRGFFISVNIVHATVTVNSAIPNQIRVLRTPAILRIPVNVHLNGGPAASISFSLANAPGGASMRSANFSIASDSTVELLVDLTADAGSPFTLSVQWDAFNGEQTGTMDFNVTIQGETAMWSVGGQTTPATLGGWAQLMANSDGFWSFIGHVHDSGFFDLFYASLIVLEVHNPNLESRVFQKDGSVTGTGNPFGSRSDDWTINGRDPFISDNWDLIKNSTAHFRLHASAEFFDILEVVLAPFLAAIAVGKFLVEQAGDINIGGGSGQHSKVECESVITNDGVALHCSVGA